MTGGGGDTGGGLTVQGLPLVKPPWGRITAIDLNKGDIVWQVAHGETPDRARTIRRSRASRFPETGRIGPIGTLTTKTLVISGESGFSTIAVGRTRRDAVRLRQGHRRGGGRHVFMPAPQTGTPMTYMLNGKQYLVVAVGGGNYPAEFLAYALP